MSSPTARKLAKQIGVDRFQSLYHDPNLHTKIVAKQLGVKEYILPYIAKALGLKTRKEAGILYMPPVPENGNGHDPGEEKTIPHPKFKGRLCLGCDCLEYCKTVDPPILPCEVYVHDFEIPYIRVELKSRNLTLTQKDDIILYTD